MYICGTLTWKAKHNVLAIIQVIPAGLLQDSPASKRPEIPLIMQPLPGLVWQVAEELPESRVFPVTFELTDLVNLKN